MLPRIHRITAVSLYFIPVQTRVPLKFGTETLTSVTCARVAMRVADDQGHQAEGWGETPLSVQWVWPSSLRYEIRHEILKRCCERLATAWLQFEQVGHPLELGHVFQQEVLPSILRENRKPDQEEHPNEPIPWLGALVCSSPFDIALHDAFGRLLQRPVYQIYGPDCLKSDLSRFLEANPESRLSFRGRYPIDYLRASPQQQLRAWHLVGGLDLLEAKERTGNEPMDGYPVVLTDWLKRDGLTCLKIKLRGDDADWDYDRLVRVGQIGGEGGVEWLSADFNCTVWEPGYVNEVLDRLKAEQPGIYEKILYVEQPFAYDLENHRIDVRSVSARKPLFLDESAHDWRMIRLGRELGWTGVALKTCKTQTGALLSACWAKAHGMSLMVQDLTNPMLAQISHVQLAANVGTIMGVETNAVQFYPAASAPEEKIHPGLYSRRNGMIDLSSIRGPGFGYRLEEIERRLPEPAVALKLD
jgi:L-alanine-DL-glutamate epimerase-like enolase superfamily enzyme